LMSTPSSWHCLSAYNGPAVLERAVNMTVCADRGLSYCVQTSSIKDIGV